MSDCVDCGRPIRIGSRWRCGECDERPVEKDPGPRYYVVIPDKPGTWYGTGGQIARIGPWCGEEGRKSAEEFVKIHGGTVETEKGGNE